MGKGITETKDSIKGPGESEGSNGPGKGRGNHRDASLWRTLTPHCQTAVKVYRVSCRWNHNKRRCRIEIGNKIQRENKMG